MKTFNDFKLSKELLALVEKQGFDEPSEIQIKSIPSILEGKDVIGQSFTGSGKTLAFGLGIVDLLHNDRGRCLILTPTRELACQVADVLKFYAKAFKLHVATIYGGVSIMPQLRSIRNSEIIVGTPGRILDHLERQSFDTKDIKHLVLDEADRMLDMGFIQDVERIIQACPKQRQTLLFSATISSDIDHLSHKYMKHPKKVSAQLHVDTSKLKEIYYDVEHRKKVSLLVHLLKQEGQGLVMVFCNTRMSADIVAENLKNNGVDSVPIHGGLSQNRRSKMLDLFHSKRVTVLVCTDVAARGLDIKGVSHVYNFDIPADPKEYVHRIGRTARAGKEGLVVNLLSDRDHDNFRRVLDETRKDVESIPIPDFPQVRVRWASSRQRGPPRGRSGFGGRGGARDGPRRGPPRGGNRGGGRPRRYNSTD